jgi:two-component system phosphate regulon response regulator PhoB
MTIKKVLIVDDDPDIRTLYRLVLHQEGLEVIEAESGQQALDIIQAEVPALVLLDIMMPDMDGYEVCRRLRANPQTAALPVLMFSAKGTSADRKSGLRVGANDFVVKSAGPRVLAARIRTLLGDPLAGGDSMPVPVACS